MCWRKARGLLPLCEGIDVALLDTPQRLQDLPHNSGATAFEILYRFHYPKKPLPEWGELADPVRGIGPDTLELFVRKEFPHALVGSIDLPTLGYLTRFTPVIVILTVGPESDH